MVVKRKKFICYLKQKKGTYSKDIWFPRINQRLEGIDIIKEAEIREAPDGPESLQHTQPARISWRWPLGTPHHHDWTPSQTWHG